MTREELINKICPKSMTSRCEERLDCNYCSKDLNKLLDEYDNHIKAEIYKEIYIEIFAEIGELSEVEHTESNLMCFVYRIKQIAENLMEQTRGIK